jgi:ketosteroid isomerase-like protein
MRQILAILVVALSMIISFACAPPQVDMAALQKTVDAFNKASTESMIKGDASINNSYYETGALEMAPNMPTVKGKDAILAFQNDMAKTGMKITAVTFKTLDLVADGKVAWEIGSYDMTITMPPMGEMKDAGKYIALWRQQADGAWKVRAETWSSDKPAAPMASEPSPKKEKGKK